ncbi:MAG: signal recognition particle protein [Acidimicrobiia bacterium]
MFESLSDRLQGVLANLRSKGKLSEADIDAVMREVRVALLEADVNFKVVKTFIGRVKEQCLGSAVQKSLTPAQQVVKIVHQELIELLGGEAVKLKLASRPPTRIVLAGLQGSGKTTACAKLAQLLKAKGNQPILVACDLQRPAAVEQLRVLGERVGVPVFTEGATPDADPVEIARAGLAHARSLGRDVAIFDTAGRLAIDAELMAQLATVIGVVEPDDTFLVVDAMIGQDAVTTAEHFNAEIPIDGVILTKLDGDARGGAALSVREVVGKPIYFAGVGEKLGDFEVFHPDRLAGRILGMGDVLTLIEKAEEAFDVEQAREMEEKLRKASFTLDDFLQQMQQVKKMGPLQNLVGMIPGLGSQLKGAEIDEGDMTKIEAIIQSMTLEERNNPQLVKASRRQRIARGSGTTVQDVNELLKEFRQVQQMMKGLLGGKKSKLLRSLGGLPPGMAPPG